MYNTDNTVFVVFVIVSPTYHCISNLNARLKGLHVCVFVCVFFSWKDLDWTSMYWDEVDKARAVQHMLEVGESDTKKFEKYRLAEMKKHIKRTV